MQQKGALPIEHHLSYESDSRFFIIDFQGWGRRELPIAADPAFYGARYYFLVRDESDSSTSAVIFWQWRRRAEFIERDGVRLAGIRTEDCQDPQILREIYRDGYAPRRDCQYDEETGLPIVPKLCPSKVWTVPESFYPPFPPLDKHVQVPSPANSSGSNRTLPSLLSRLSVALPEPQSPTSGNEKVSLEMRGRPFSWNARDFVSSTPRLLTRLSSHSRSPRNTIGPLARNQPR